MSDYGSDDNDCHSESTQCRNLQTVLDRATDRADIYVTSQTLSLDSNINQCLPGPCCLVESSLSYNLYGFYGMVEITCKGRSYAIIIYGWSVCGTIGANIEPHLWLFAGMWKKPTWLPYWLPRGHLVLHHVCLQHVRIWLPTLHLKPRGEAQKQGYQWLKKCYSDI